MLLLPPPRELGNRRELRVRSDVAVEILGTKLSRANQYPVDADTLGGLNITNDVVAYHDHIAGCTT